MMPGRISRSWPAAVTGQRGRDGFSLLEILLALAILGGSLALLSRIAETGTMAAREARDLSIARILCQTKLSQLLLDSSSGITPQSVPSTPLESFDSQSTTPFVYSMDVQPATLNGLLVIRVTVEAQNPNGGPPLARYSLSRWMVDPALGLEEAEEAEKMLQAESAGTAEAES
jgi:prepilin-type N-terminal cleavage/methylation domain-containing protein